MDNNFIYRIGSIDNHLPRPPRFFTNGALAGSHCRFASVYAVRSEDAHCIEEAGTAAQFKGIVWSQRLWVDFDNEEAGRAAQSKLKELKYDHCVYTTGNRGCHIGIARDARPSHLLPIQDKLWVKANLPGADLSLYWHLHLIRLPGAIHEATGKPKSLIYKVSGNALVLPSYTPEEVNKTVQESNPNRPSIFSVWEIVSNLTGGEEGNRHQQLLTIAGALRNEGKVTMDEAMWVCAEINRGFSAPKSTEEVERIVRWVYNE